MILLSQYKTNFDVQDHRVVGDCYTFTTPGPVLDFLLCERDKIRLLTETCIDVIHNALM